MRAQRRAERQSQELSGLLTRHATHARALQRQLVMQNQRSEESVHALATKKADLDAAQAQLRDVERIKTNFFQSISHELRTPLTLLVGPLEEMARQRRDDPDLQLAVRHAYRLYRLVNQLLDFQRVSRGGAKTELRPVSIVPFLDSCADYFRPACAKKRITFRVLCEAADPKALKAEGVFVLGQVELLEKIIFNFLSNAWKFCPTGGVIDLILLVTPDKIHIEVRDTGAGVRPHDQDRLFSVFSQVGSSTGYEGLGLGLALVKELASMMHGSCGVKSEAGQGARFWAAFPRFQYKSVLDLLVVDDDQSVLDYVRTTLAREPWLRSVGYARGLSEAHGYLARHRVRCVLTDAMLAGDDGIKLLAWVETSQPLAHRALMTGSADRGVFEKALNQRTVQTAMLKPFKLERLREVVKDAVLKSAVTDDVAPAPSFEVGHWHLAETMTDEGAFAVVEDTASRDATSKRREKILIVDDLEDMRGYIARMLGRHGFWTLSAGSADEAMRLAKEARPDLVICDWMMPVMSGMELIQWLRADPDLATIPTVLLTAKSDEESSVLGTAFGADAYLNKPFNDVELVSCVNNLLRLKEREAEVQVLNRKIAENVLTRYLPPNVVQDVLGGKVNFDISPRSQTVTVMFADLCQFTRTTAALGPQGIAKLLNRYLIEMTELVFSHQGTVDKFIGDGIMALFGVLGETSAAEQIQRATSCARAMQAKMASLNQEWGADGMPRLALRIGIHTGPVVMGHFGGERRSDFTAIGTTVNIASRIEAAARPDEILLSSEVRDYLPFGGWEEAGAHQLKGLPGEFRLYRLSPQAAGKFVA